MNGTHNSYFGRYDKVRFLLLLIIIIKYINIKASNIMFDAFKLK